MTTPAQQVLEALQSCSQINVGFQAMPSEEREKARAAIPAAQKLVELEMMQLGEVQSGNTAGTSDSPCAASEHPCSARFESSASLQPQSRKPIETAPHGKWVLAADGFRDGAVIAANYVKGRCYE